MIETESTTRTIKSDTDVIEIEEQFEPTRITRIKSTKRSEQFHIVKAGGKFNFFKILYESGKSIPGLDGQFTSHKEALDKVIFYLKTTKQTKNAIYKERWGDKPVPELKTKKIIRKRKVDADSSTDTTHSD